MIGSRLLSATLRVTRHPDVVNGNGMQSCVRCLPRVDDVFTAPSKPTLSTRASGTRLRLTTLNTRANGHPARSPTPATLRTWSQSRTSTTLCVLPWSLFSVLVFNVLMYRVVSASNCGP